MIFSQDFNRAVRELDADVDAEATWLARLGIAKWDALIQARQRVELRRRQDADRPAPSSEPGAQP